MGRRVEERQPCNPPDNRPYFRPNANATRGQLAKIRRYSGRLPGSTRRPFEYTSRLNVLRLRSEANEQGCDECMRVEEQESRATHLTISPTSGPMPM